MLQSGRGAAVGSSSDALRAHAPDRLVALAWILDLVRSGKATGKPHLAKETGLGRTVVNLRIAELMNSGLVVEDGLGTSSGGRAPRRLSFRADRGHLLVAELGATSISVGVATLGGELVASRRERADVAIGPEIVLGRIEEMFDELLSTVDGASSAAVWGVGIGVPGPVEYRTGRPVSPPIMPGWDDYPIRDRFEKRFGAPVWVDNDVNLMALGELHGGAAQQQNDVVYVKVGSGIGAGLVNEGRLHRGAQGVAGDVGHIAIDPDSTVLCRCGNFGCLEAIAGGSALVRQAREHLRAGGSIVDFSGDPEALALSDLSHAASRNDPFANALFDNSARRVGQMLAALTNIQNPSLIVMGGAVSYSSDRYLATVREVVLSRSLALATRDLTITTSRLLEASGLLGAARMVIDELFSPTLLGEWLDDQSPRALLTSDTKY
jgi:glucokinase-like ROK family protein